MSWFRWLGIVVAFASMYGALCGFNRLDQWAAKRRRSRRSALERRMRARARCAECGAIGKTEFVTRTVALLGQVRDSDEGRAIGAVLEYGRRVASQDPGADGVGVGHPPNTPAPPSRNLAS